MTRPIYGSRLLKTAQRLAGVNATPGRPALSDLRRATSTAYYAVFHQIVRHSAFDFLPVGSEKDIADIARWYAHTGMRDAAGIVVEAGSQNPLSKIRKADRNSVMAVRTAGKGNVSSELLVVVDAFQTLQEARHSADYDGNYDPVRAVTINHVEDADAALKATRALWRASESLNADRQAAHAGYQTFLRLALLKSGGPRGR